MARPLLKDVPAAIAAITNQQQHTMTKLNKASLMAALVAATPCLALAGSAAKPAPAPTPAASPITGTLGLNVDSKFVSFGSDVWGKQHALFHPSLELTKTLSNDVKLILGTWWDVNDQASSANDSTIGHRIQEVDVWAGASYTMGSLTFTGLYQNWMYGGRSEQAVELKVGLDTFLKPSLLIHQRFTEGASGGEGTATIAVLGAAYDFSAGPVSFSIPAAVSVETDGYHNGDAGFGFGSLGLSASVPTPFISEKATFSASVTGYLTNGDVITGNKGPTRSERFLNFSAGFTIPF